MNETITLEMQPRAIIGKQVRQLRQQGVIPGVIYGPVRKEPMQVQVEWMTLRPVLLKAGGNELVALTVNGETINALIHNVQRHPVRGNVLHVDFYAVDVNAAIRTHVPVMMLGEEATIKRLGVKIFQTLNTVEIECLPTQIPQHIEIDLAGLKNPGDMLTVADLPYVDGVTYHAEDDVVVVRSVGATAGEDEEVFEDTSVMPEVEVIGRKRDEDEEFED